MQFGLVLLTWICCGLWQSAAVATEVVDGELVLPVRFHIVTDLVMEKNGLAMGSWITPRDIETTVITEVNRIWRDARIVFRIDKILDSNALNPSDKAEHIRAVVSAQRDRNGESDPQRIAKLYRLINFDGENSLAINIYLVPYLGEASQGNTKRRLKRIVVGQWTDKAAKGNKAPERFQLVEGGEFIKGSLSRTVAHELGHVLGLKHPDPAEQTEFGLLMGGKHVGYRLTHDEIRLARQAAVMVLH